MIPQLHWEQSEPPRKLEPWVSLTTRLNGVKSLAKESEDLEQGPCINISYLKD